MTFSVLKEEGTGLLPERRVALTPLGVGELVRAGARVYVEKGAGLGAGFSDEEYEAAGARVVYTREEALGRGEVLLRVSRPSLAEAEALPPGRILMGFLHLAVAESRLLEVFKEKDLRAVGYELIGEERPILRAMSEIAGRLSPQIAGRLLESPEGPGILLSGLAGIPPAEVVILGAGVLGRAAARSFLGLGASVYLLDKDLRALEAAHREAPGAVTALLTQARLERYVGFANVLIGAVAVPGERTPVLLSRALLEKARPGTVLLDFSIDQGGVAETSRPGVYKEAGVLHFALPNVPALVARTASHALTMTLLPYLLELIHKPLEEVPALARGLGGEA
jgi:alanine dehydrogenase